MASVKTYDSIHVANLTIINLQNIIIVILVL